MQQYAGIYLLQVYSVLSKLAVNKYLHTVASCWILSINEKSSNNTNTKFLSVPLNFMSLQLCPTHYEKSEYALGHSETYYVAKQPGLRG